MTYAEKLKDPRWQKKRLCIMQRDGFKCRDCGCADKTLHVHHCMYQKGDTWDTSDEFLLTLCEECHELRQGVENDCRTTLGCLLSSGDPEQAMNTLRSLRMIADARKSGALFSIEIHDTASK